MKYLIILLFIFSSCNSDQKTEPEKEKEINEKTLTEYQKDSISQMKYLTDLHSALNEPKLNDLEYECYRLTLHKPFKNSMIFRLDKIGGDYFTLIVKEFDTKNTEGNAEKADLINEMSFDLNISEFNEFKKLLNQSYFWTLKYWDERTGLDGSTYVLEGLVPFTNEKTDKTYHCVGRWAPYDGSFKQACEKLVDFYNIRQKK